MTEKHRDFNRPIFFPLNDYEFASDRLERIKLRKITFKTKIYTTRNKSSTTFRRSRDSTVLYRWDTGCIIGGSSPGSGWEFFSSPPCPEEP
jgi:hypothetical protein